MINQEEAEATFARAEALHAKGLLFGKPEVEDEDDREEVDESDDVAEEIDLLVGDQEDAQEDVYVVIDGRENNEQKDREESTEQDLSSNC